MFFMKNHKMFRDNNNNNNNRSSGNTSQYMTAARKNHPKHHHFSMENHKSSTQEEKLQHSECKFAVLCFNVGVVAKPIVLETVVIVLVLVGTM